MKNLLKIENYEKGVIIERLNRFVVKGKIKNRYILAHLNNTGRLEDFIKKGRIGLFLPINADYADFTQTAPTKLKFRLSMIKESKNIYSVIDTQLQMKCFEIALEKGYISWLSCQNSPCLVRNCPHRAKILKRNFRINHSLIDYLIEHKNKKYLLEVKSAVMKYKNFAMYPDCPSVRGQKHIRELIDIQSTRITDRINLPESSDRIESTRITRLNNNIYPNDNRINYPNEKPNNNIYPNKRLNNLPEYQPNEDIYPNDNRIDYPNNRPNKNKIFGEHSGNKFGIDSGSEHSFGPDSGNTFGQNSGKVFGEYSGDSFGPHSGSDVKFGQDSGKTFGHNSGRYFPIILFIAGMKNISAFSPNKNADTKIYELLRTAKNKGVQIKAIQIYFDEKRKSVILKNDDLPVVL